MVIYPFLNGYGSRINWVQYELSIAHIVVTIMWIRDLCSMVIVLVSSIWILTSYIYYTWASVVLVDC